MPPAGYGSDFGTPCRPKPVLIRTYGTPCVCRDEDSESDFGTPRQVTFAFAL